MVPKTPKPAEIADLDDMSDEEFVEAFKEFSLSSPIRIPKDKLDPNYVYKWLNRSDSKMYQTRRGKGWSPVTEEELRTLLRPGVRLEDLHIGTHISQDKYVVLGDDMVFGKMAKRRAAAIRAHISEINKDRVNSSRNKFHQTAELLGVSSFERPV